MGHFWAKVRAFLIISLIILVGKINAKNPSFARVLQSTSLKKPEPWAQLAPDELKTNGLSYFKIIKIKLNSFHSLSRFILSKFIFIFSFIYDKFNHLATIHFLVLKNKIFKNNSSNHIFLFLIFKFGNKNLR